MDLKKKQNENPWERNQYQRKVPIEQPGMFVFILWLIHWFGAGQFGYSYMSWLFGRYPREKTRKVDTCCFMVFKKVLTHFSIFLLLTPAYLVMATKLKPHGAMIMVMMMMRRRRPTPRHTHPKE